MLINAEVIFRRSHSWILLTNTKVSEAKHLFQTKDTFNMFFTASTKYWAYCLCGKLILTWPALLNLWPANIIWNANFLTMGLLMFIKQCAACSNRSALRRSESYLKAKRRISIKTRPLLLCLCSTLRLTGMVSCNSAVKLKILLYTNIICICVHIKEERLKLIFISLYV